MTAQLSEIDEVWNAGRSLPAAGERRDTVATWIVVVTAIVVTIASTWLAIRYSGQALLDIHRFRETQTAITSYWMLRDGFRLAYETPVLGKPWSIPFEFPLYQYLVAQLSALSGVSLDRTGRLVSYAFLLACLVPCGLICRRLFPTGWKTPFAIFVALFLSSPLYLYWGRSFMIETAALFFAVCFILATLALIQKDYRPRIFILAGVSLALAMLQKLTTVVPDLAVLGLVLLAVSWRQIGWRSAVMWKAIASYGAALAVGYIWVRYTDRVKLANPAAAQHLMSSQLTGWNFGALAARLGKGLWVDVVWDRTIVLNIAGGIGVTLIAAGLILAERRLKVLIALCLALFLSHFLIFENLQFLHSYYQVADGIFVIAALALALHGLAVRFPAIRRSLPVMMASLIAWNAYCFWGAFFWAESWQFGEQDKAAATLSAKPAWQAQMLDQANQTSLVAKLLRERTDPARPIVVYGYDWSSEVAYYSERKAMTVPDWLADRYGVVDDPARYLGEKPSAIVVCGTDRVPELRSRILNSFRPTDSASVADCDFYFS